MEFSRFGSRFAANTGILALMDDMGRALEGGQSDEPVYMLGGGNPAHIPEVNALWRQRLAAIAASPDECDRMLVNYDTPQGKIEFLEALAGMLRERCGWPIDARNIAITNGSQSASFILFNLFAGRYHDGSVRRVLFPVVPEYIGYADQSLHREDFIACRPRLAATGPRRFKYQVDFDAVARRERLAALCVSRPTNPSGNVLTDAEMARLAALAAERGIPLIVDNAYGLPFPGIVFSEATPYWDENIVLSMSLSKLGLPAVRTGIVIARPEIINAIAAVNAVAALANGSLGQCLTLPMIRDGSILKLSREVIGPYYRERAVQTAAHIDACLAPTGADWAQHEAEGALFLWIWFKNLPVGTDVLYERLKRRNVVVVPGHYFFFGDDSHAGDPHAIAGWDHRRQCLRLSYAQDPAIVRRGIEIMAEEVALLMRAGG